MSGCDKSSLMQDLIDLGWKEVPSSDDCQSRSGFCLVPPDSLWNNKPRAFYVYDARDLQNILGKPINEE